jgi:ankyrin repeat protein
MFWIKLLQLKWGSDETRANAALALKKLGNKRAITPLLTVLMNDKNFMVKTWAVAALEEWGWQPANSEQLAAYAVAKGDWQLVEKVGPAALEFLLNADLDNQNVVIALGKIGDPRAIDPLITALEDKTSRMNEYVRMYAAEALGKIRDNRAVEPLAKALLDEDNNTSASSGWPPIKFFIAEALAKLGDKGGLEILVEGFTNYGSDYQKRLAPTLDALGWQSDIEQRAKLAFAQEQWDKITELGAAAVEPIILSYFGSPRSGFDDYKVKKALNSINDDRAIDVLVKLFDAGKYTAEIVKVLGSIGDERVLPSFEKNRWGEHKYEIEKAINMIQFRIKALQINSSDVNVQDNYGETPLITAATHGQLTVVQTLLAKGAEVDAVDSQMETALMKAVFGMHTQVVQTLLASGANVNAKNYMGITALMMATHEAYMDMEILELLLSSGADVNAKDNNGRTALMFQVSHSDDVNVLAALLARGADINAVNNSGETVMMLAEESYSRKTQEFLKMVGASASEPISDEDVIICGKCDQASVWNETFYQDRTLGTPRRIGEHIPDIHYRIFCPKCGHLIAESVDDAGKMYWVKKARPRKAGLVPTKAGGRRILESKFEVPYSEDDLNIQGYLALFEKKT